MTDEQEIRQLAELYAQAVDRRDGPLLTSLFTEDGIIDSRHRLTGRTEIAGVPARLDAMFVATQHAVNNHTVELAGDAATGEAYCTASHIRRTPAGGLENHMWAIRYQDRYVRQDGRWLFAHRVLVIDWTETRPASAG